MPDDTAAQVWYLRIPSAEQSSGHLATYLAPHERAALARLTNSRRHCEFVAVRAMTRIMLGRYLGMPPTAVPLRCGPWGKPEIAVPGNTVRFNVSHSGGLALLAIAVQVEVGVDVEGHRPRGNGERLAARYFPAAESAWLGSLAPAEREAAFLRLWTRKEAVVKATGERLARGLRLPVTGSAPVLVRDPAGALPGAWRLLDLEVPAGYVATLAVPSSGPSVVS
ncbi:4'-phosphopantetheinyl transferase family protein [Streptomyces europaeiscabiei]|uniref:4'-phosphopantetheinyl transferase family protein n=1 Tax=Streptomyces europaeiscabiei TaxID=146819 RepID=UPI0029A092C3|nr:4'-phosphopantetheinyl transferase superfamily protein [Streptomyces europaeiscabiei]MDX2525285.1 4'-phosphopantetheinyl transferase superfamily protein [Streptomyces europaeiscabiei]